MKKIILTEREKDILICLLNNVSKAQQIAEKLVISVHTVNENLRRMYQKANVDSKLEFVLEYMRQSIPNFENVQFS